MAASSGATAIAGRRVTARVNAGGLGRISLPGLRQGAVVVRAKGFGRTKLDWVNDEAELNVFVEPEATLTGTVIDEAGQTYRGSKDHAFVGTGRDDERPGRREKRAVPGRWVRLGKYRLSVIPNIVRRALLDSLSSWRPAIQEGKHPRQGLTY